MRIPDGLESLSGIWTGTGTLWFDPSQPPAATFDVTADVSDAAKSNLISIAYTWSYEGDPKEGIILIGTGPEGQLEASWLDSWHMADSFMISKGTQETSGIASVLGSYGEPGSPEWGWRTVIEAATPGEWRLTMFNIPPGGEELLAFELLFVPAT